MIIVVDAYNFLKSITGTVFIEDRVLRDWTLRLQRYAKQRNNQVIMVFDSGPSFFPSKQKSGLFEAVYVGQGRTADDYLKQWLEQKKHEDILLVTSDREIRRCAAGFGVVSMSSQDFHKILIEIMQASDISQDAIQSDYVLYKTKHSDQGDSWLDDLMDQGSQCLGDLRGKDESLDKSIRMPDQRKSSKTDKMLIKKINKI